MSTNLKLRTIAAKLPKLPKLKNGKVVYNTVAVSIAGDEILKANPSAKLDNGNAIDPKKMYKQSKQVPLLMDHFEAMRDLNRSNGKYGVNKYIAVCFDFNKISNPGIKF